MMTKKDIFENNGLYRYLIGDMSPEESLAIEEWISADEEVKKAYEELEVQMEKMAMENAISPPADVKNRLWERISKPEERQAGLWFNSPIWQGIAAGLVILLAGTAFYLFYQFENLQDSFEVVIEENNELLDTNKKLMEDLNVQNNLYALLTEPNTEKYILKGNEKAPSTLLVGYINHQKERVILKAQKLPELPENRDLQLWADVDGEMINMGVLTKGEEFIAMSYIPKAESLNITIEPMGGSDHPTVSNLIASVSL